MKTALFLFICTAAAVWSGLVFYTKYVRLDHQTLIQNIKADNGTNDKGALVKAIADYEQTIAFVPCDIALHQDLALLAARGADIAMAEPYGQDTDFFLGKSLDAMASSLSCNPRNGEVWLDFAIINNYYEGFTTRSLQAFKRSQHVTPNEAWLAEKRVIFALEFRPLLDAEAIAAVRSDLATLERGAGFRIPVILKASGLKSPKELVDFF
jgi:hypothetical protein